MRRYPLDKTRYEVMLEVTNTNPEPANVELTLLGDGDVVDVTRLALGRTSGCRASTRTSAGASRTLEARDQARPTAARTTCPPTIAPTP